MSLAYLGSFTAARMSEGLVVASAARVSGRFVWQASHLPWGLNALMLWKSPESATTVVTALRRSSCEDMVGVVVGREGEEGRMWEER
jgi:hypothetical protein